MALITNKSAISWLALQLTKCPRGFKKLLSNRHVPFVAVPHFASSNSFASELDQILGNEYTNFNKPHPDNIRKEYMELFSPNGYDPGMNDIRTVLLPRVVKSLNLNSSDIFVDMGCANGKLAFSCVLLPLLEGIGSNSGSSSSKPNHFEMPQKVVGIDLSPLRIGAALAQLEGLQAGNTWLQDFNSHQRLSFVCGDVCDPNKIPVGTVYFLGIKLPREDSVSEKLLIDIIAGIRTVHHTAGYPFGHSCRVICTGFPLPKAVEGARIVNAICFPVANDSILSSILYQAAPQPCSSSASSSNTHHLESAEEKDELQRCSDQDDEKISTSSLLSSFESFYGEDKGSRLLLNFDVDLSVPI